MPSALLWASLAEEYFYFGVLKSLRAFQNPFFTGGVVTVNGSCCVCFLLAFSGLKPRQNRETVFYTNTVFGAILQKVTKNVI